MLSKLLESGLAAASEKPEEGSETALHLQDRVKAQQEVLNTTFVEIQRQVSGAL